MLYCLRWSQLSVEACTLIRRERAPRALYSPPATSYTKKTRPLVAIVTPSSSPSPPDPTNHPRNGYSRRWRWVCAKGQAEADCESEV